MVLETVRLLGVDAPDNGACGAREAVSALLEVAYTAPVDSDSDALADVAGGTARRVTLRTDLSQPLRDGAGRVLAHLPIGGGDVGAALIASGVAGIRSDLPPFARYNAYADAEDAARGARVGIHGTCGGYVHISTEDLSAAVPVVGGCGRTAGEAVLTETAFGELISRATGLGVGRESEPVEDIFSLQRVICEDLDGDGQDEMNALYTCCTVSSPSALGVFKAAPDGRWQLVHARLRGPIFKLERGDNQVVATEPVYSRSDSNCCPSRLREVKVGWTGTTFGILSSRVRRTTTR